VGYENDMVVEVGFRPRTVHLKFRGTDVWTSDEQKDPLWQLLRQDPQPVEFRGFLVFKALGVTVTGYHDDDESQRAITCFVRGRWDELLARCTQPNLLRYKAVMPG